MDLHWSTWWRITMMENSTLGFSLGRIWNTEVSLTVGFQLKCNNICTSLLIIPSGLILFNFYSIDVDLTKTKMFKTKISFLYKVKDLLVINKCT